MDLEGSSGGISMPQSCCGRFLSLQIAEYAKHRVRYSLSLLGSTTKVLGTT